VPQAVIFDLDGVLIDSEPLWNKAKKELVLEAGGKWGEDAPAAMIGMSSPEWSSYMQDHLGVDLAIRDINGKVVSKMEGFYRAHLPVLPGAVDAVRALQGRWPLGLASSSNREIIDLVLRQAGLTDAFNATVSSEEVEHGKPAPDVYLEAARLLNTAPAGCVAIEDSSSGLRPPSA
jgi:beta-phosphoglucomutase-like phosphatase (HAD superfamily)